MEHKYRKQLEEFVSPSDFPLFDLVTSATDDLCTIVGIFSDRNCADSTSSFVLGIIKAVIAGVTGRNVDCEKLMKLIIESEEVDDKE